MNYKLWSTHRMTRVCLKATTVIINTNDIKINDDIDSSVLYFDTLKFYLYWLCK